MDIVEENNGGDLDRRLRLPGYCALIVIVTFTFLESGKNCSVF